MKILVYGNSGSGKSTLAMRLAKRHALAHLDLDTIVWAPGQIAVLRPAEAIAASLHEFLDSHAAWVIEGCYGELVEAAAPHCSELVFLNPGRDACLANNKRRPWEPHKYASPEAQDAMLTNLQAWVSGYYERDDDWSYCRHRHIFDAFGGNKTEHVRVVPLHTDPSDRS
ncbi:MULTISPECIES: shikimate kinase [Rhodanobacter]|uniref:shikimate kinase n=1 Tax=Rhodanobacter TaxID=75309 RepID=UPI00041A595A|nr:MULTISPECIES: shikimate kinase [Rhodanobacter]KZC21730.1 shikimate kinase [Rhodanobacter denitrificans]UJJ51703.1 shikimate kinase [Rhodanobacter denitrificans]UJM94447.1 shikimate kinase [Rhodanobacter denitrificans]UJM97977.1 shikimate kinase [Rhodanobacter denitrificans]UJN22609.1 shikimate kinase [Rhodanobacter denitrificans]